MKHITKIVMTCAVVTALFSFNYNLALAQNKVDDKDIPRITCNQGDADCTGSLETVFASVVTVVGTLFGFGFFAMMIYGGVKYLLSGGDPKALQSAKGTITWAIIGLAFLAISYTILLVIKAFTGVDVTRFRIGV